MSGGATLYCITAECLDQIPAWSKNSPMIGSSVEDLFAFLKIWIKGHTDLKSDITMDYKCNDLLSPMLSSLNLIWHSAAWMLGLKFSLYVMHCFCILPTILVYLHLDDHPYSYLTSLSSKKLFPWYVARGLNISELLPSNKPPTTLCCWNNNHLFIHNCFS